MRERNDEMGWDERNDEMGWDGRNDEMGWDEMRWEKRWDGMRWEKRWDEMRETMRWDGMRETMRWDEISWGTSWLATVRTLALTDLHDWSQTLWISQYIITIHHHNTNIDNTEESSSLSISSVSKKLNTLICTCVLPNKTNTYIPLPH